MFDVDDAGFIDARKLFNVIRLLGYNPTEAEVQDLIAAGDKDGVQLQYYYISRESQTTRNVLWPRASVCLCVCQSVRGRMPTLLHGPGCNLGSAIGMPPSCALLGGFAIGARVALLWQDNANAKC